MADSDGSARAADLRATALRVGLPHPEIGQLCIELAEVAGAGITMMTSVGNSGIVYASDETAAGIEELQFVLGEGPCMQAFNDGDPVFIADLEDPDEGVSQQWPTFLASASALGVRAVYAIPLCIGAIRLGVMDLYRREPGRLSEDQLASALLVADLAALSLLHPEREGDPFAESIGDRSAYRFEVHQATGMIKVQSGLSIAESLVLLRACAFSHGRPIGGVAEDVVAGRLTFPLENL